MSARSIGSNLAPSLDLSRKEQEDRKRVLEVARQLKTAKLFLDHRNFAHVESVEIAECFKEIVKAFDWMESHIEKMKKLVKQTESSVPWFWGANDTSQIQAMAKLIYGDHTNQENIPFDKLGYEDLFLKLLTNVTKASILLCDKAAEGNQELDALRESRDALQEKVSKRKSPPSHHDDENAKKYLNLLLANNPAPCPPNIGADDDINSIVKKHRSDLQSSRSTDSSKIPVKKESAETKKPVEPKSEDYVPPQRAPKEPPPGCVCTGSCDMASKCRCIRYYRACGGDCPCPPRFCKNTGKGNFKTRAQVEDGSIDLTNTDITDIQNELNGPVKLWGNELVLFMYS